MSRVSIDCVQQDRITVVISAIRCVMDTYQDSGGLETLIELSEQTKFKDFCMKLVKTINMDVKCVSLGTALQNFHLLSIGKLPSLWNSLFIDLQIPNIKTVLIQSVNRQVFNTLLIQTRSSATESLISSTSGVLKADEENAIRYASGFVAMKLKKKYEKHHGAKAAQFVECLSTMAVNGKESSFYDYTAEWVKLVDRGGLFHVCESAYLFFQSIELKTQEYLPRHLQKSLGYTSKEDFMNQIEFNEDVQFYWSMIAVDIDDATYSQELLHDIVRLWITVRGYSTVSSWLEAFKKLNKTTTKGKKGLRKDLKSKKNSTTQKKTEVEE